MTSSLLSSSSSSSSGWRTFPGNLMRTLGQDQAQITIAPSLDPTFLGLVLSSFSCFFPARSCRSLSNVNRGWRPFGNLSSSSTRASRPTWRPVAEAFGTTPGLETGNRLELPCATVMRLPFRHHRLEMDSWAAGVACLTLDTVDQGVRQGAEHGLGSRRRRRQESTMSTVNGTGLATRRRNSERNVEIRRAESNDGFYRLF